MKNLELIGLLLLIAHSCLTVALVWFGCRMTRIVCHLANGIHAEDGSAEQSSQLQNNIVE